MDYSLIRRAVFTGTRLGIVCLLTGVMGATLAAQPNIVFIISDDMGYSDLGCYGGEIETPNLDRLAERGVRFTNYYVNNMCWPTRGSLLTGLYPRTAVPTRASAAGGLHPESITLPEALRQGGYATYMVGKWHLASDQDPDGPHVPHHRGFDHFYGTLAGASDFFAPYGLQLDGRSMTHEWRDNPDYYYSDALTDHALKFLRQHVHDQGPEQPFFLYMAFNAAHWPLHAKDDDIAKYAGRYRMGWDALRRQRHDRMKNMGVVDPNWALSERHTEVPVWSTASHRGWQERRMEVYAAQVTSMDENIGRVLAFLREQGLTEDTLVVYQHDNGGCHVEYDPRRTGSWTRSFTTDSNRRLIRPGNVPGVLPGPQTSFQSYGYGWANASNTPFRYFKQHDHEGGTRSPLIVSWPRGMAKRTVGGFDASVLHVIDMMPCLLEVAGINAVQQRPFPFEGQSFRSAITTARDPMERSQPLFWAHSRGQAVRANDWKLVRQTKGDWELYNLRLDGTERQNLARSQPERVAYLAGLHRDWLKRTDLRQRP